jgi:hypothetical protein
MVKRAPATALVNPVNLAKITARPQTSSWKARPCRLAPIRTPPDLIMEGRATCHSRSSPPSSPPPRTAPAPLTPACHDGSACANNLHHVSQSTRAISPCPLPLCTRPCITLTPARHLRPFSQFPRCRPPRPARGGHGRHNKKAVPEILLHAPVALASSARSSSGSSAATSLHTLDCAPNRFPSPCTSTRSLLPPRSPALSRRLRGNFRRHCKSSTEPADNKKWPQRQLYRERRCASRSCPSSLPATSPPSRTSPFTSSRPGLTTWRPQLQSLRQRPWLCSQLSPGVAPVIWPRSRWPPTHSPPWTAFHRSGESLHGQGRRRRVAHRCCRHGREADAARAGESHPRARAGPRHH